jgi:hypothetical protein
MRRRDAEFGFPRPAFARSPGIAAIAAIAVIAVIAVIGFRFTNSRSFQ